MSKEFFPQHKRSRDIDPNIAYPQHRLSQQLSQEQEAKMVGSLVFDFEGVESIQVAQEIADLDRHRLNEAIAMISSSANMEVVLQATLGINIDQAQEISKALKYDHSALLMASAPDLVTSWLIGNGFFNIQEFPSEIVKNRLQNRYRDSEENPIACPTRIIKADLVVNDPDQPGQSMIRKIELFLPSPAPKSWTKEILLEELNFNHESHVAFILAEGFDLRALREKLLSYGCLPDGGGTNLKEGTSTYYFDTPNNVRIELISYTEIDHKLIEQHKAESRIEH